MEQAIGPLRNKGRRIEMSAGKYLIETDDHGEIFVGSHDSTKQEALEYVKREYNIKRKDIKSCRITAAHKAREAYIRAIRQSGGDLRSAAVLADSRGYNPACDFQDEWHEARSLA